MATVRLQLRRGLAEDWFDANPTLAPGEIGIETDTNTFKFGDGNTPWRDLDYALSGTVDDYIALSTKGVANGVASLDGAGLIPLAQLPGAAALDAEVSTAVTNHNNSTTNVHGIADTSLLATTANVATAKSEAISAAGADATAKSNAAQAAAISAAGTALSTHESDTTNIHGIADTSTLVTTTGSQTLISKSLTSPALTGTPTAPTASAGTDTTQVATTAFVQDAIELVVGAAPAALNTLAEIATSLADNADLSGTLTTAISGKVAKSGDTMSGELNMGSNKITSLATPTVNSDASTKAYVDSEITRVGSAILQEHNNVTVSVHGISNTANLVYTNDSRLTDARNPLDASVTQASLQNNSVITDRIVDLAVTTPKIADSSVTAAKILDSSITTDKLSADSVTTIKISDLSVTNSKLSANAVTEDKISGASVTTSKIADDSVTTAKIADSNITTAKINNAAVTSDKLDQLAVVEGKIADSAVTTAKIADSAVTTGKIATSAIFNTNVSPNAAIETSKIDGLDASLNAKLDSATAASTYAPIANPTFTGTVSGVTKSHVGLENVDNTADTDKPVSTATQTALDAKANLAAPTFTGTVVLPSTTSIGDVSSTEIGYVNGVTSSIQTQIDAKASIAGATFTGNVEVDGNLVVDGDLTVNGTSFNASATSITIEDNMVQLAHQNVANTVDLGLVVGYNDGTAKHSGIVRDVSADKWKLFKGVTTEPSTTVDFTQGSLDALQVAGFEATSIQATSATIGDVSNTELQYLNGVTSAVQTQIDSKSPIANPTFTGTVTVAASGVAFTDKTQTRAGVPSLTTIATAISSNTTLDALGTDAAVRDSLVPLSGAVGITFEATGNAKYAIGSSISFYQSSGTGANFIESGITVLATPGRILRTTNSSVTATKIAATTWLLAGDLR